MTNKNGTYFVSIIRHEDFISASWDPFVYKSHHECETLSDYVQIRKVETKRICDDQIRFRPIEYRDLPGNDYLSFALASEEVRNKKNGPAVEEQAIILGTMRAYLGNIAVTPKAEWLGYVSPLSFQTKSEFVSIKPHDGLVYFWLIYLRSKCFLQHLPLGGGGTRPRLSTTALEIISVSIPDLQTRQSIHDHLQRLAKSEWETRSEANAIIKQAIQLL